MCHKLTSVHSEYPFWPNRLFYLKLCTFHFQLMGCLVYFLFLFIFRQKFLYVFYAKSEDADQVAQFFTSWVVWYSLILPAFLIKILSHQDKWATAWQNQQNDLCTQRRLRSAWASAQSDQSLPSLCALRITSDLRLLHADSEDSDQTGRRSRLIWVFTGRMSFCWFCHAVAQFFNLLLFLKVCKSTLVNCLGKALFTYDNPHKKF